MKLMIDVAYFICRQMKINADSPIFEKIKNNRMNPAFVFHSYVLFASQVGNGKPWDYKQKLEKQYLDLLTNTIYPSDIWGNIHYGWIGLAAGFSRFELLSGGGFAQLMAGTVPSGYLKRRLQRVGDADVLVAFDDPRDQLAIKIGMDFYLELKNMPNPEKLIFLIRKNKNELL